MVQRVAIVSGVRTPIGKVGKAYADVHPVDLLATSLLGGLSAAGITDPAIVDQVMVGCVSQSGEQAFSIGRNGWLAAGLPYSVPALTLDTQCGSSQQTVNLGAAYIMAGQAEIVVTGGIEAWSRVSLATPQPELSPIPPSQHALYEMPHQGIGGERIAAKYGVTREQSDAYGVRSHLASHAAWEDGRIKDEIVFHEVNGVAVLERDEGIRPDSTIEKARTLKPVYTDYKDGIITAASASQLSDGSSCVVLASEKAVERHGLQPLAWVRRVVSAGVDPDVMLEGPIEATKRLLERENLTLDDIDVFEVHEAYATVVEAWRSVYPVELERLNLEGGAISVGHPFGASGGRQIAHLAHALNRGGGRLGLQVMCCGGGVGTGTILEAV
jgi:acetyl-CoA acetyltransferase family protein